MHFLPGIASTGHYRRRHDHSKGKEDGNVEVRTYVHKLHDNTITLLHVSAYIEKANFAMYTDVIHNNCWFDHRYYTLRNVRCSIHGLTMMFVCGICCVKEWLSFT